jgi:hypothetical protein
MPNHKLSIMKNALTCCLILLGCSTLIAQQTFVQPGAKWHYEYEDRDWWGPPKITYTNFTYTYTTDTVINGHSLQCIERDIKLWKDSIYYIAYQDSALYILDQKDTTDLRLIFDFKVAVHDSFSLTTIEGNPLNVYIDSIYTEEINGIITQTHKAIYRRLEDFDDTLHVSFNNRLGPLDHFLFINQVVSFYVDECWDCFSLRCYEDDQMPLYNPEGIPCDSLKPGTTSIAIAEEMKVIFKLNPNPATSEVTLSLPQELPDDDLLASIRAPSGQVLRQQSYLHTSIRFDTTGLPPGMYYVTVHRKGSLLGVEKLVVN